MAYEYKDTPFLSKVRIGEKDYYLKDAEARNVIDSILSDYLKAADKTELQGLISALAGRVTTIEGDYITEAELTTAIAAEATARDTAIAAAINALDVDDTAEDGKYVSAVKEVDGKIEVTREALPAADTYSIKQQGTPEEGMAATYYLIKNNVDSPVGAKINIAKDQFLKEARFFATKAEAEAAGITVPSTVEFPALYFLFVKTSGEEATWVPVKDLVDVYTAGNGITIANGVISAKVKTNDPYLEVTADGIASKGIDTAITTAVAAEAAIARAAEGANATAIANEVTRAKAAEGANATAIANEVTRATGVEAELRTDVDANAAAIEVIEGKEAGWDAKLNTVKVNGEFKTVATDSTNGKYVDLGAIATTDGVIAELNYNNHTLTAKDGEGEQVFEHSFGDLADTNLDNLIIEEDADVEFTKKNVVVKEYSIDDETESSAATLVTANYTPAGSVTINALNQTSTAAELTKADYTPEGTVSVTLNNAAVLSSVKSAGTLPTYEHTGFSGGSLAAATKNSFATKVLKPTYEVGTGSDAECLILGFEEASDSSYFAQAVTEQGAYTPAVYGTDDFTQGAMPTFNNATVGVQSSTFSGTEVKNFQVTGVNYDKATANGGSFSGTEVENFQVTGVNYKKQRLTATDATKTLDIEATAKTQGIHLDSER